MSKLFTLNTKDYIKGLVMSILVSAVTIIQQSLESGTLVLNWKAILIASISGGLAYLMKNFFTSDNSANLINEPALEPVYTEEQERAVSDCVVILDAVGLELVGTRPKDR